MTNPRTVSSINFDQPYVEGMWMVEAKDSAGFDNVCIVGPDENVRLVVDVKSNLPYKTPIGLKIEAAQRIAELLNRAAGQE